MNNPNSPEFRTHQEMNDVYQSLAERDLAGKPYVLEYERNAQELIFFGSIHSGDPEHEQTAILDEKWQDFISSDNPKKHVLSEGTLRQIDGKTKKQAIRSHGESGQICWLALEAGLPITSPEPDRGEEITQLHSQGFSYEQIITYYFARQMLQWSKYDRNNQSDWATYAESLLELYSTVHDWGEVDLSLKPTLDIYGQITGEEFDAENTELLYKLSDPAQNPVSSASGRFRDKKLYDAISNKWHKGYSLFVVYGSGHAIVLEPALERLVEAKDD